MMPETNTSTQTVDTSIPSNISKPLGQQGQKVKGIGPDGKPYVFPAGTTMAQVQNYFKKKGITAKAKQAKEVKNIGPGQTDKDKSGPASGASGSYEPLGKVASVANKASAAYGDVGGIAGTILGGGVGPTSRAGAALGGGAGEAIRQIQTRILTGEGPATSREALDKILVEATKQAGLQYGTEKIGEVFFKVLDKIPHGVLKNKIPFLPSDISGGRMTLYFEQLLANLWSSSKTMTEAIAKRDTAIEKAAMTWANGMSHFTGTSEQFGKLMQDSLDSVEKQAIAKLKSMPITKMMTPANLKIFIDKSKDQFYEGVLNTIRKSLNPEQISGLLVNKSTGHQEIRNLFEMLEKADQHATVEAARTQIGKDLISETLRNSKSPVLKQSVPGRYTGDAFIKQLDKITEDRLKAIFTPEQFKALQDFADLTKHVSGTGSSFLGRFLNLGFVMGPFRGALSVPGVTKLGAELGFFKVMAKVMTSPDGIAAVSAIERARLMQAPKALNAAYDVYKKVLADKNKEYEMEKIRQVQEYNKQHGTKIKPEDIN